jgi:integrase
MAIRAAKLGITIWDDKLRGFGVRCLASGTKTFIVLIASGGRQSIGRYPLMKLSTAREEATRILSEKNLGKVRPKYHAYDDARDAFIADCETRLAPLTVKLYKRHLTQHFPFGRTSVGDITPRQIMDKLKKLDNRPSEKEHAARIGRTFFKWSADEEIIDRSPMEKVKRPPTQPSRERVLSEEELTAVYTTALKATSGFHRLVLLITHTGGRRTETTRLEWPYIASDTLTFRAETRKARKKDKRDHTIPIGPRTAVFLRTFPKLDGCPYVFPASREHIKGKPTTVMTGYSAAKREFDKECGVTGWTLHDLRRTMVTVMCEKLDVLPHIADWLIAHVSHQPSGAAPIYNRAIYMRQAREAVEKWEAHLASLVISS